MVSFSTLLPTLSLLAFSSSNNALTNNFINSHQISNTFTNINSISKNPPSPRIGGINDNSMLQTQPNLGNSLLLSANDGNSNSLDPDNQANAAGPLSLKSFHQSTGSENPTVTPTVISPEKHTPPFKFISSDKMVELKEKYPSQETIIDTIKEKFLFHDIFEENRALELFLMDSQGLSLSLATEIAAAHGRGYFIVPPNANLNAEILGELIQFMKACPDGIIVVPSISNIKPAIFPPEFLAARGVPTGFSSVYQYAKLAEDGVTVNPQAPPITSKNKFLFVIANKNINNPDKVFGFHNRDVDTSALNADIFLAYMGAASKKYQTDHSSIVILENRDLAQKEYVPLIDSFIPDVLSSADRESVIDYVTIHANEKTDYREFKHLAADKIAQILAENND